MRWFWLSCPQCGWKAAEAVNETVKDRVMNEVTYCRECDRHKRPRCKFVAREVFTITPKG
jgi:uncharacterized Zn finger protein